MNATKFYQSLFCCLVLSLSSCKKDPTHRLSNPFETGSVSESSNMMVLYDDQFKSGGGLGFIPGGENQSIDVQNKDRYEGENAIRYSWNGQDVTNFSASPPVAQHAFAGFQFTITPNTQGLTSASPRDLSSFNFSSMTFLVKGALSHSTSLRIEGPSDGLGGDPLDRVELTTLSGDWQEVVLPLTPSSLGTVRTFLTISFQYSQPPRTSAAGSGGVIYLDRIRYVK